MGERGVSELKSGRHFRFQETTEKGTSVRPLSWRAVCVSLPNSECVHVVERVESSILKSEKIERFWKAQMCQRSEGSIHRPYHGKGGGERRGWKTAAKGKPMKGKEVSE